MDGTVSVVIPVYNVEAYLERCIKSVVEQTYEKLEIIIVNDGSTDRSREICQYWVNLDDRIILIDQKNKGLGPARNRGIKRASGEYIAFIDSDDWWELNAIEELMKAAVDNDADVVYMNFYYSELDVDTEKLVEREFVQYCLFDGVSSVEDMPELLFQSDMRMWSRLLRRSLFVDNNIYMPAHPYEDFPTMPLLLLKAKRVCQVHKPLYHYFYKRNGNLTGNTDNHKYIACGLQELYQNFEKQGYLKRYGDRLSDYASDMAKGTLDDMFIKYNDKDKYQTFAVPFWDILEKHSPKKIALKNKKAFLFGSRSGELICKYFLFTEQILGQGKFYTERIESDDIKRMIESDYIFVDFLTDGCESCNAKCLEEKYDQLVETIEQYGLAEKIVLLKLLCAEKHGIHKNMCTPFENIDEIKLKNQNYYEYYKKFESDFYGKIKVIGFDEIFNYTYEHTKAGCYPCYYHGEFHKKASDKIRESLMVNE